MPHVYLDHQATTPLDPLVLEAMLPFFSQHFGNAAGTAHPWGRQASEAVATAREQVASLIGAHPLSITFTSGATEAINLALKGLVEQHAGKRRHIVTCVTEHPAARDTCAWLVKQGCSVTELKVNRNGHIDEAALQDAVTDQTLCVNLMLANNEVGTLHPIARYTEIAHASGAFFHCDATQAVGKLPVHVNTLGVDLMSFSAHKFYGPKGVGALYRRMKAPRVRLAAQIHGGGHERDLRSGTLNVPGIVGMGKACAVAAARCAEDMAHTRASAQRFLHRLSPTPFILNGEAPDLRLPGNLNLRFPGLTASALMKAVPELGLSAGSACSTARPGASHVLLALGLDADAAAQSFRLGCGRFTTQTDIDFAARRVVEAVASLRNRPTEAAACSL